MSLKSSHIIRELVHMEKPFEFAYGSKSNCTSINERFFNLEGCLHSRQNNEIKTLPPFGNELLTQSKNISMTSCHIMYPLKKNYLCDYVTRCIMSNRLILDETIMNIIPIKKLAHRNEENDSIFKNIESNIILIDRGSL